MTPAWWWASATGSVQVQLAYGFGLLNAQPGYPASFQAPNEQAYYRVGQLSAARFSGPQS